MSVFNFKANPGRSAVSDVNQKTQPDTTIQENLKAGFSAGRALQPMKPVFYEKKWWAGVVDQIEQQTGETFRNPINPLLERQRYYTYTKDKITKYVQNNQDKLRLGHPDEPGGSNLLKLDPNTFNRTINNLAREEAKKDRAEADEVYSRADSFTAKAAYHLGGFIAGAADPLNVTISAALGPLSIGTNGLARTMFREAIINMSAEVIQQPAVKDWYESLGIEYTFGDFRNAVLAAGVIGAGFPVVIKGTAGTIKLTAEQMKKGSEIIFGSGGKQSDVARGAEIALNDTITEVAENPLQGTKAELEHKTRTLEAVDASADNRAPAISDAPAAQVKTPETIYQSDNLDGQVFRFSPDEINVDAKLFQFKEDGDEFGVTDRFKGVTQWDPEKSGQIVVYEYADGRQFIADGHQRLGLAKKIKAADPSQDVRLYGSKLREVDGVTEDAAVVKAAMKNIAEGTGTKTDAAKVFRLAPEQFDDPSFPKTGAFIQQARALANLTGDSFGLVKNGIVSEEFGALVGRLVPDNSDMQLAAMNVLAKVEPSNAFQAESIIRQVMETGVTRETQQTLFGEEVLAESLFLERAKVLDAAQNQLRKDKAAFSNITKNASKLEGEGNQLAADANQKRLLEDGTAIALLQSQANKKGALSDALTDAARLAKDTGKYGQATTSFVEAVRRSIDSGDFEGPGAGDVGRAFNDQAEEFSPRNDVEQSHLEDFDNPNSDAVASQTDAMVADMRAEYNLDMFDQGAKSAPGDRQMDLEQLIAEDVQAQSRAVDEPIRDLQKLVEANAPEQEILTHPAINRAIADMEAIPRTNDKPDFNTDNWFENRQYVFKDNTTGNFDDAMRSLVDGARRLGWEDAKLKFPDGAIKQQRRAVIVLGPPAAGKSTIANPIARKMGAAIVDADEAKKILPEYQGGIGANAIHEESSLMSDLVLKTLMSQGDNIVLPKVGGKVGSIERNIAMLKKAGYEVDLVDMKVGAGPAMKRMISRFIATGRLINPDYVKATGDNPGKTYDILRKKGVANGYTRLDNEGDKDAAKLVIEDTRNLLEGVDLRLRRSGDQSGGDLGRAAGGKTIAEISERTEAVDLPSIQENLLDEQFPVGFTEDPDGQAIARTVTARQLFDEIAQEDAMVERLSRCPI